MVAKSFPRKQDWTKKNFDKTFRQEFLWFKNHFFENRLEWKKNLEKLLVDNFYGCKIISSRTG